MGPMSPVRAHQPPLGRSVTSKARKQSLLYTFRSVSRPSDVARPV